VVNEEPACDPSVIFLVLPVSNFVLSIDDLTVRWGCVATTGGSLLFCFTIVSENLTSQCSVLHDMHNATLLDTQAMA
jgi:hypothetical protein